MVKQIFKDNPKSSHKELSLSVVHILATCSSNLRKGLQQEFYQLNDRCEIRQNEVFLLPENHLDKFFGSRINVQAVVGVNGSGKSSLFEIIYRVINNLSCLLNRGKRRKRQQIFVISMAFMLKSIMYLMDCWLEYHALEIRLSFSWVMKILLY